ncbi:hypothetical protein CCR94_22600 [Rhodoblastus sphagnicola]|uniref:Uncharacterized protein n=1 Tax=Rhodoblastus sphagnicola TaxID=333368 RepID=A0A2S6MVN0_9HYPH|nr:hypothetical protein [Rhodoblastus sphagnicola]MBB4198360.1 hypothetical protein [Rhodoblastus sphagnicola]PPQ26424.1 hypothetical protein CCR94_22600 [Rhodoblastus sphagnicola]
MTCERQISEHLERALVETMFAIAEFDHMRATARARGETTPQDSLPQDSLPQDSLPQDSLPQDSLAGILLLLRSALDSALTLTRTLAPDYGLAGPANGLAGPDSNR